MDDIKSDPRFAHILSDPKFRLMPKSKQKVKIDSRFQSVFSNQHFSHKTHIDKRGRPVFDVTKRNKHVMKRFYQLSDDDDINSDSDKEISSPTRKQLAKRKKQTGSKVSGDSGSIKFAETEKQEGITRAQSKKHGPKQAHSERSRGTKETVHQKSLPATQDSQDLDDFQDSSNHVSTDDDDENDDTELPEFTQEFVLEETDIDHKWNELHTDAETAVESTCRLAVCNMDWDFVRAQDLFVLFKSFVPAGGHVNSVTIYPSEFGLERMAEEAKLGPREMREHANQECTKDDKKKSGQGKKTVADQQQVKKAKKDLEAAQTEKLREYQLNRLRYYFAVVDCDSIATADSIYNECDGREYLLSSVRLDLRFIPDNMTFDYPPRETFTQEQSILEYEPSKFSSTALCQAKVDVTWDETEFDRLSRRMSNMQQKELESIVEENKYADVIAPPESDSDMDDQPDWLKDAIDSHQTDKELTEEEKITLYRELLMKELDDDDGGDDDDDDDDGGDDGDELAGEKEGEKEFVWQPGLKSSLVKKMEKKARKKENAGIVGDYLDKKKEKKKKKKEDRVKKRKLDKKEQSGGMDVSSGNKMEDQIDNDNTADLHLLVMEDDSVKDTDQDKTQKKKKNKRLKKKIKSKDVKDDFKLDVDDPRFAAVYTSHHFHIDPSSSQFTKTKNMDTLMNEQIKRRGRVDKSETVPPGGSTDHPSSLSRALVHSLKSKLKK